MKSTKPKKKQKTTHRFEGTSLDENPEDVLKFIQNPVEALVNFAQTCQKRSADLNSFSSSSSSFASCSYEQGSKKGNDALNSIASDMRLVQDNGFMTDTLYNTEKIRKQKMRDQVYLDFAKSHSHDWTSYSPSGCAEIQSMHLIPAMPHINSSNIGIDIQNILRRLRTCSCLFFLPKKEEHFNYNGDDLVAYAFWVSSAIEFKLYVIATKDKNEFIDFNYVNIYKEKK